MKPLIALFVLAVFFSCSNSNKETSTEIDSTVIEEANWRANELETVEAPADRNQYYVWEVNPENKTLQKNPSLHPSYYSVDTLLLGLNERYPKIQLEKVRIGHDTLYTRIQKADYLTEQMGSYGSEQYIAYAVLNLTAVPGIQFVRIDFTEGSHAQPDVWSKRAFSQYKVAQ